MQIVVGEPIVARFKENRRPVLIRPILIEPEEEAPIALRYSGYTSTELLRLTISGEAEWLPTNINKTGRTITIFKCEWAASGNPCGYCWHEHLIFEADE